MQESGKVNKNDFRPFSAGHEELEGPRRQDDNSWGQGHSPDDFLRRRLNDDRHQQQRLASRFARLQQGRRRQRQSQGRADTAEKGQNKTFFYSFAKRFFLILQNVFSQVGKKKSLPDEPVCIALSSDEDDDDEEVK